jgi:hypothetical protein
MDVLITCPSCRVRISRIAYLSHHRARCEAIAQRLSEDVETLLAEMTEAGDFDDKEQP